MIHYTDLFLGIAPEIIVALTALAILALDLGVMKEQPMAIRLRIGALFASAGCAISIVWLLNSHGDVNMMNGMLVADPLIRLVKAALLFITIATLAISTESRFTAHPGEYMSLVLFATVGFMFMAGSEDILMIFLSLELASLSLYILAALNKQDGNSAEAALKYFLFGGMSAAFTLFGLSLLYGLTGATHLRAIAHALAGRGLDPVLALAMVMTAIGLGFKVAAAPFHLWAPDAYQGAPTPVSAFIASGSKVASFFLLARVMMLGFAGAEGNGAWKQYVPGWIPLLAVMAALSVVLGNVIALAQTNVKRLLAYSAVAHAGYMLLGVLVHGGHGLASVVFYSITYALTSIGAFGVVALVVEDGGDARIERFAGLSQRSPVLAWSLMVFLLSLAGIPPLAGFVGKFYLFAAAASVGPKSLGLLWLVILAVAMSVVSIYYYLLVLKQAFVGPPAEGNPPRDWPIIPKIAIGILAAVIVLLGCAPNLLLGPIAKAVTGIVTP